MARCWRILNTVPNLQGRHNGQNAGAAIVVCQHLGMEETQIQAGLNSFRGLAHRLEILGNTVDNITFVNDSKATNADAAAIAFPAFPIFIGLPVDLLKMEALESLVPLLNGVEKAYLIGEAASQFALIIGDVAEYEISDTLEHAVASCS